MNLKKIVASLIIAIMLVMATSVALPTDTYAGGKVPEGSEMYIKASVIYPNSGRGYSANADDVRIWNFQRYTDSTGNTKYQYAADDNALNYYCLKEGIGFSDIIQSGNFESTVPVEYNTSYDMKTEKASISEDLTSGTVTFNGKTVNRYSALLALLDRLYYMTSTSTDGDANAKAFLNEAGIYFASDDGEILDTNMLTNEEIRAVQQAAIWFFTNYGEEKNGEQNFYDFTDNTNWLKYTTDAKNYTSFTNNSQKYEQAEPLYNYLINQAIENASKYDNTSTTSDSMPIKIENTVLNSELTENARILGPIKIDEIAGNISDYDLSLELTIAGQPLSQYTLLDENKEELSDEVKLKDLIGKEFYISLSRENVNDIKPNGKGDINNDGIVDTNDLELLLQHVSGRDTLEKEQEERANINSDDAINVVDLMMLLHYVSAENADQIQISVNVTYTNTELNIWSHSTSGSTTQPILVPTRKTQTEEIPLTITPGAFDLALRKYIVSVDGTTLEGTSSRVPTIDEGTLSTDTTATYKHKKDPVVVKNGSKVIYKMTIYNEGEKEGRATKVVDQLPEGLKFVRVVSGNFESDGTYSKTGTNTLTLVRKTGAEFNNNLPAYSTGSITSGAGTETIEIECEVTATAGTSTTILTNLAWISEAYNAVDNQTITNQTIENQEWADRDSEPSTIETKTAEELVTTDNGYTGSGNKENLADSTYYYKGQQDDDDFEKLILEPVLTGNYQIQLEKVDKNNNTVKLEGAEFSYTLPGAETAQTGTTDENGILNLGTVTIEDISTKDTITVTETKAPKNYEKLIDSLTIEVTKGVSESGESYVATNAIITSGEVEGTSVSISNNIIKIIVPNEKKVFDLKLIKRIVAVNDNPVEERIESIDVSNLNLVDQNGNLLVDETSEKYTTANYQLNKDPVAVKKGDIVTYTFRVYNEGTLNGYAQEITEDVPEGLEFLYFKGTVTSIDDLKEQLANDETLSQAEKDAILFNSEQLWTFDEDKIDENGRVTEIHTDYLSQENGTIEDGTNSNLIEAFGKNDGTKTENDLHYKEVSVKFKVIAENSTDDIIRNEAAITEDSDEENEPVDDRDSDTETWEKYEDDEDYDNIILQEFDLALRKFIIAVSKDETIEDSEYLRNEDGSYTRAPVVDTSKLNEKDEEGNIITTTATYNHTKEPVLVQPNDIVVYNIRVYNEGEIDGYAAEIKDHLPPYLEFVDNEFNSQYGWEVSSDGRTVTTTYLADELIEKAELLDEQEGTDNPQKYRLTYKEVPIMCRVIESAPTSENITNIADITLYLDDNKNETTDRDSEADNVQLPNDEDLPGYKDDETGEYIPGQQDDDDFEKVNIKIFDLALRKWVTQAIVIENGQQTVTETGHDPWDDPEEIVKVELHRKKLNEVTVKFRYSIRVYNQGEIAGYAKEVTDYIPEGLTFIAEDNPGWTDEGNNVISTTLLADTLLQPGEYADVEVVLTWINNENNMGVMTNTAEISIDENDYDIPDIDSTPDNQKEGEDDIDDAPVMLSVSTGQMRIYFTLGFIVLITVAGGVVLIKKYVL